MRCTRRWQLERWLPRACSGEHIGGMGMSEPSCGTDVLAMRTTAQTPVGVGEAATPTCRERRGSGLACCVERAGRLLAAQAAPPRSPPRTTQARAQPDGSFKLNGTKMWITNGAVNDTDTGDVFLVCARGLRRRPRDAEGLPRSAAALRRSRHPLPETAAQAYTHRALGAKRASRLHTRCTPPLPAPHHAFTTPAGRRYARTGGPEKKPSQAISLFMIERGMPGFSLGQRLKDK